MARGRGGTDRERRLWRARWGWRGFFLECCLHDEELGGCKYGVGVSLPVHDGPDLLMFAQSRNIHWHFGLDTSTRIAAYLFVHDVTSVDALSFVFIRQCAT